MVESFRNHPNQFCYKGKPVLSTFGGGRKQANFVKKEFTGERAICYVPFFYPTPATEMPQQKQVDQVFNDYSDSIDGFFHFGAAGTPEQITESNHLLAHKWLGGDKLFMAGITPYYRGQGGNYRVYGSRGFEGLAKQWEGAIRDKATWVEIVTWNDWGESSYLASFGSAYTTSLWNGHWGAMLSHAAFLKASRYYIEWYKKGRQPSVNEDALYYFYRLHSKSLDGIKQKPGEKESVPSRPRRADTLTDEVFVTLFLKTPAKLTIHSGTTEKSFDVDAGVNHISMPFAAGQQHFVLTRGTDVIIDKRGEQDISATEALGNFNIFSGEAKPVTVRVRKTQGGPQIQVNGESVPPRFFWGQERGGLISVDKNWKEEHFEFIPDNEVEANGTLHFRFGRNPGELWLKNLSITEVNTGTEVLSVGSFANAEAFNAVWRVWPMAEANTVGKVSFADKALHVTLINPKNGKKWPDFHLHTGRKFSFGIGTSYRCSFQVKGSQEQAITPAVYSVSKGGVHTLIGGAAGPFLSQVALARDAGVDLISFAASTCWQKPGTVQDWTSVDALCRRIIAVNPDVLLVPRFSANAPGWWLEQHPEARMTYDPVTSNPMACVSDRTYRADVCAHFERLARHMGITFPENFAGLHPCGQNTGEWFYYNSWGHPLSGYDAATRSAFRKWLTVKGDPQAATAEPPTAAERRAHSEGFLRDPAREKRLIEFALFQQQEMSDFVKVLAAACRRGTDGKKLVLFFYGYGFEFGPLSNGAPTSGHYALGSLLRSKDIDILCSPISYFDRKWLGTAPAMSATESVKAAGILWLNEDDSRTYLDPRKDVHVQEGGLVDLKQSQQVMLRNTAQAALRGFGTWWMDLPGQGWFNDAAIWQECVRLRPVDNAMLQRKEPFTPEIAAVIDETSMCYLTGGSSKAARPLIYEGRGALGRCGAPYGQYLMQDVIDGSVQARMQVFLSAWHLTPEQRTVLAEQRKRTLFHRMSGWFGGDDSRITRDGCWAPGLIYPERRDVDGVREVTGFKASLVNLPTAVVKPTEIGRKYGLLKEWGPETKIDPLLSVEAASEEVRAVYSDGSAAVAMRKSKAGLDVFVGVPQLTPELIHAIAKISGVHLYTEPGPALWAAEDTLSLQAQTNGFISVNTGSDRSVFDALNHKRVGIGPTLGLEMETGEVRVLQWQ
jgi:beta-galactosidase